MKKVLLLSLFLVIGCGKKVKFKNPQVAKVQVKLNGPLATGGGVSEQFQVSSDRKKVVYIADETTDTVDDLYVVNTSGTSRLNLTNLPIGRKVIKFQISPDSSKIVFLADINNAQRFDLYRINMDGSGLVRLNQGLPSISQLVEDNFKITNESNRVVYLTDEVTMGVRYAYIVNVDGTNRIQLTSGASIYKNYELARDNGRIVYRTFTSNPVVRSVRLDATLDVMINTAFNLALQPTSGIYDFKISPDSTRVAYRTNQDNNSIIELYSANIDGSGLRIKLNNPMVSGGSASAGYDFSPDGTRLVYIADQNVDEIYELFSVGVLSGAASSVKLNSTLVPSGDVLSFKITADSLRVVYLADKVVDSINELFSVAMNGTNEFKINSALSVGSNVVDYSLLNDRVVYSMNKNNVSYYDSYQNSFAGSSEYQLTEMNNGSGVGYFDALFTSEQIVKNNLNTRFLLAGSSTSTSKDLLLYGSTVTKANKDGQNVKLSTSTNYPSYLVYEAGIVFRAEEAGEVNLYIMPL